MQARATILNKNIRKIKFFLKNIPTLTKQQKSTKYIDKINILTIFIIGGWMNTLKRIFVISLATLFSTTSVFAMPKKCKYPQYRQNHPEKCGQMAETSNANGAIPILRCFNFW